MMTSHFNNPDRTTSGLEHLLQFLLQQSDTKCMFSLHIVAYTLYAKKTANG